MRLPRFGKLNTTGSGGYGTGEKPPLLAELGLFTRTFPQYVFMIFYFYWDNTQLSIYRIQGNTLLDKRQFSMEEVSFGKIRLTVEMKDVIISNDISEALEE